MQEVRPVIYYTASGRKMFYKTVERPPTKKDIEMATKPYKDAVVVTGQYQDASGATKNRSQNVGTVLQRDDGTFFLVLNRTFNPAGVPNPENRDTLIINFYDLKPKEGVAPQSASRPQPAPSNTAIDDDEPF